MFTDGAGDYRESMPINMEPIIEDSGISSGYLRQPDGITELSSNNPGLDRGGINWNSKCYRVLGTEFSFIAEQGAASKIGDVKGSNKAKYDYSFDYLCVVAGGLAYLYDGSDFNRITDMDLGAPIIDVVWVDGYFMFTDGTSLIVTDLDDPFSVNPLKYGSSEVDPDKVVALKKIRNEVYAVNRNTIEVFDNIGGNLFPFQRIEGAQMTKGGISTDCVCTFMDTIAFVGGSRNEPLSVWIGSAGSVRKISTREIEKELAGYTENTLVLDSSLETVVFAGRNLLYLHLPNKTLVYNAEVSQSAGKHVWHQLISGANEEGQYLSRNYVYCYDKWMVGHPTENKLGMIDSDVKTHWGDIVRWRFGTKFLYNNSRGGLIHELELVGLPGNNALSESDQIYTQHSEDGRSWSKYKYITAGPQGNRSQRLRWRRQGRMSNYRTQRFGGTSNSRLAITRLEARVEPLAT
jgi:hypothetical protein